MTHILANIAWCSNDWTKPTLEGTGFGHVRRGNLPHEGYNFKFDHLRNTDPFNGRDVVHGYVEMRGVPRQYKEANDGRGICFFSSEDPHKGGRWMVGLYGHCWVIEPTRKLEPAYHPQIGEEFVNLCGEKSWSLGFEGDARVRFDGQRFLPTGKSVARHFNYIGDTEARAILQDAVDEHCSLPSAGREPAVQDQIAKLEALLIEVGGTIEGMGQPVDEPARFDEARTYREGQQQAIENQVTARNPALARDRKMRDDYRCQVCGFRYEQIYRERGRGFAECHHLIPLSEMSHEQELTMDDVITVCANCHRMLHRGDLLTQDELTEIMSQHGWRPNECRK